MNETIRRVIAAIWVPAVRRAAAEAVLMVASAAIAAAAAFFQGASDIDPITLFVARSAIAWAERVIFQAKQRLASEPAT